MPIDPVKLAKLQNSKLSKVGGTRRKNLKAKNNNTIKSFETKLSTQLAKFDSVEINDIVEANFFQEDGNILHFEPVDKLVMAPNYNLTALVGGTSLKKLDDVLNEVLPQLGPEAYDALSQLDEKIKEFEELKNKETQETN